jgi:putative transposase
VIFCPKYRRKVLNGAVAERLKALILEKQEQYGYTVMEQKVMPDHVHLLLDVDPRVGVDSVVAKIKGYTSHELRREFPWLKSRLPSLWTRSKFISTVGAVTLDVVQAYIADQKGV